MMDMMDVLQSLKVIPVIKLDQEASAVPLTDALTAGGLPIAEITYRTAAAPGAIKLLRKERPSVIVGTRQTRTMVVYG
jgi:2-dehydro-3-deoxyphosphogluconate aldolase/(4S)-4-hydroxy-2-oxoglutarate aldolase